MDVADGLPMEAGWLVIAACADLYWLLLLGAFHLRLVLCCRAFVWCVGTPDHNGPGIPQVHYG